MAASAKAIGSVKEIFESMEYGAADESRAPLDAWISDHNGKFGHFINNEWVHPKERKYVASVSPFDKKAIAQTLQGTSDDVNVAVNAASNAYKSWNSLSGHERAKYLYSFARTVQKHSRILAVLESLDNGKTIRETRDCDIPLVIRHLYYYAGWAQIMDSELSAWKSIGVVGAIVPWNFPLMLLAWKICPALAAGNTVVLKPATNTRLSALMLAELAAQSGLPKGVFNVITGGGALGSQLASHSLVDKVAFTGSTEIGQLLRRLTAGSGKKLSLELGGKSPVIVFDSADLDSAVEGVVDAIWFNQGQVCSAGSRLFVQESVYSLFIEKVKTRMQTLRLGSPLDKTQDMGPVVSESQKATIESYVKSARDEGAQVHQIAAPEGCFYPPTLITDVTPSSKCVAEEIFGPVLVAMSFRTAKEAIALANNSIYGLGASVFSEKITLAVETAKHIKSGAVWINAHNLFDAAAGFGGYKQSGFGRDGGKEGMYEYIKPKWQGSLRFTLIDDFNSDVFGSSYKAGGPSSTTPGNLVDGEGVVKVDRTYKLYYGGQQKRPDGNYSRLITNAEGKNYALVGEANRKDVRNAVECAVKAQPSWEKKSGFNRSQILYYIAENLDQRRGDFSKQLQDLTGLSKESCEKEVQLSVSRLFTAASYCDKHGGEIQETTLYGTVIKLHEAMGVIGIACPDASPLLSFVSLTASAIARGNAVVAIPSEKYASVVLAMYQIFETSDLPGGVINILTGSKDHLSKYLTEHHGLQAMWYFGSLDGSRFVEHCSAGNVKRTWVDYGVQRDWKDDNQGQGQEFLYHATQVKNIWLTMGDIFAN